MATDEFDGSQAIPILHPDYSDRGPQWALQVLAWIDEGNIPCLRAVFRGFTHEVRVRVSEDADEQTFPCTPLGQEDGAETVDVLATNGEAVFVSKDFPAPFVTTAENVVATPAAGRINHGVDGLPVRPEFGGLDPYWCGVYIAKAGFYREGDTLLDMAIRTKKPLTTLQALWDLGGRSANCTDAGVLELLGSSET